MKPKSNKIWFIVEEVWWMMHLFNNTWFCIRVNLTSVHWMILLWEYWWHAKCMWCSG